MTVQHAGQRAARAAALREIEAERQRRQLAQVDICDWGEQHFYIAPTRQPVRLPLHQKAILRFVMAVDDAGLRRWKTVVYSTVKKSGKTTIGGLVARYVAETQTAFGEVYALGNDWRQAKERSFKFLRESIQLTPGAIRRSGEIWLPDQWRCQQTKLECLTTGTIVEALSVDAAGEAGAAPDMSVWTEAWGIIPQEAQRFWEEMTPVATKPNSFRMVESYAGYSGESVLLESLYEQGTKGRQVTAGELAQIAHREKDGERYADFLHAFEETGGDPSAPVPIWVDENAKLAMYWDTGLAARRMSWQRGPVGEEYYRSEEATTHPLEFNRKHLNLWSAGEGEYIPLSLWDACKEDLPPFLPENKEPVVLGVDAATTGDCFAIVAVTRHPDPARQAEPAIRAVRKWTPPKGGKIDYSGPEEFIRVICQGGCLAGHHTKQEDCVLCREGVRLQGYNVVKVACDPFQLEDMMGRLQREDVAWMYSFDQGARRLKADRRLYDLVINRRLAHDGNEDLREHIQNCAVKLELDQDSKMRIVKRSQNKKVDLAVASSMAVHEHMKLLL